MKVHTIFIGLIISAFLFTGCAQIPQAAIDVNKQVSNGITVLGENGQEMVRAWEGSAYKILDERWSRIHSNAETTFRAKKSIPAETPLSSQQIETVAGIAVLTRDGVREKIHAKANSMRATIAANTKTTLDANESITNILVSANAVGAMRKTAIKQVGSLIPMPPAISGFIDTALKTAGI